MSRSRLSHFAGAVVIFVGVAFLLPISALACATLSDQSAPNPENFITSERAVIIWDEAHKIEHFIRQANILTQGSDLGFLVPTPQMPELAEADDRIFEMAAFVSQPTKIPPTNYRSPWTLISPFVTSSLLHLDRLNPSTIWSGINELKASPGKPAIIASQDVAGYHATILAAQDEQKLSAWLSANGYIATPELKAWLKPYVAKKWTITAFRLIKTDDAPVLTTRAIRLSFHTDQPFYPYSEPSDRQQANAASPEGRALRVSILSNERMAGALAENNPWPEKLEFSGLSAPPPSAKPWTESQWLEFSTLSDPGHGTLLPTRLTTFIDESNPRPGTSDLYFFPDPNQNFYQGESVDFTLPPRDRLIFNYPLRDAAGLLMLIVLPSVPLYCGWRVLNQRIEKPKTPLRSRLVGQGLATSRAHQKLLTRIAEAFIGVLAILLGAFYGAQFLLLFLGELASAFLGWSNNSGDWIWTFVGLLVAVVVIVTMSWGVIFCGAKVLSSSAKAVPLRDTKISFEEGLRQGFMGASSFIAGCVALVVVESVVVSML